jgi:8-oxo-dGTP diphosphatase
LPRAYGTIIERRPGKRNFRRKALAMGLLKENDEIEQDVAHGAARLYHCNETKYRRLVNQGFLFEL